MKEVLHHHVGQTLLCMAGYDNTQLTFGAHQELDLPFGHLLKSYKSQNPAPPPQLAISVATTLWGLAYYQASNLPFTQAIVDLVTTAFFFLLGV